VEELAGVYVHRHTATVRSKSRIGGPLWEQREQSCHRFSDDHPLCTFTG
jgi:hypothetical protein